MASQKVMTRSPSQHSRTLDSYDTYPNKSQSGQTTDSAKHSALVHTELYEKQMVPKGNAP